MLSRFQTHVDQQLRWKKKKKKKKKLVYSITIHGESCNFSNEEAGSWHGIISLKLERTNPVCNNKNQRSGGTEKAFLYLLNQGNIGGGSLDGNHEHTDTVLSCNCCCTTLPPCPPFLSMNLQNLLFLVKEWVGATQF